MSLCNSVDVLQWVTAVFLPLCAGGKQKGDKGGKGKDSGKGKKKKGGKADSLPKIVPVSVAYTHSLILAFWLFLVCYKTWVGVISLGKHHGCVQLLLIHLLNCIQVCFLSSKATPSLCSICLQSLRWFLYAMQVFSLSLYMFICCIVKVVCLKTSFILHHYVWVFCGLLSYAVGVVSL